MCEHLNAITVRSGVLRPEEELVNYNAAWCPQCFAYRDASYSNKARPWNGGDKPWNLEEYQAEEKKHEAEITTNALEIKKKIDKSRKKSYKTKVDLHQEDT